MKKFILPSVFAIAMVMLAYFGYTVVKSRYSNPSEKSADQEKIQQEKKDTSLPNSIPSNEKKDENNVNMDENLTTEAEGEDITSDSGQAESYLQLTTKDCDNSCKNFTDAEDLKYCQNICGIATQEKTDKNKSLKCQEIEDGLEADYCFKNLAIDKNDVKICQDIIDASIKKSCINRFIEDILDQVPQQ